MPQAIMDPGEVRRFAEELKRFNIEIQNRMALLQARFAALGDTWQDQEHQKFSEKFRDTMRVLKKFIESSNEEKRNTRMVERLSKSEPWRTRRKHAS